MVLQICIACGTQLPLRIRFCTCGHVMVENVTLNDKRRGRNRKKRVRRLSFNHHKAPRPTKAKATVNESREFYLCQAYKLKIAERKRQTLSSSSRLSSLKPSFVKRQKERHEDVQRKLETLFSSPVFQKRMQQSLHAINNKLLKQRKFLHVLEGSSAVVSEQTISRRVQMPSCHVVLEEYTLPRKLRMTTRFHKNRRK